MKTGERGNKFTKFHDAVFHCSVGSARLFSSCSHKIVLPRVSRSSIEDSLTDFFALCTKNPDKGSTQTKTAQEIYEKKFKFFLFKLQLY